MRREMKRCCIMLLPAIMILALLLAGCSIGEPSVTDSAQTKPSGSDSSQTENISSGNESDSPQAESVPSGNGNNSSYADSTAPIVYFTSDISPEGLMAVYEALGVELTGKVAVKISTGEPPASNYLRPELIRDLVQSVNGTIVECNTLTYN